MIALPCTTRGEWVISYADAYSAPGAFENSPLLAVGTEAHDRALTRSKGPVLVRLRASPLLVEAAARGCVGVLAHSGALSSAPDATAVETLNQGYGSHALAPPATNYICEAANQVAASETLRAGTAAQQSAWPISFVPSASGCIRASPATNAPGLEARPSCRIVVRNQ